MKLRITFILLLILPCTLFSQEVILESEKMTSEDIRAQEVEKKLIKLADKYYRSENKYTEAHDDLALSLNIDNLTIEELYKEIQNIEGLQYIIQAESLDSQCKEINRLGKSIGRKEDYCVGYIQRVSKILDDKIKKRRSRINALKQGEKEKEKAVTLNFENTKSDVTESFNKKVEKEETKTEIKKGNIEVGYELIKQYGKYQLIQNTSSQQSLDVCGKINTLRLVDKSGKDVFEDAFFKIEIRAYDDVKRNGMFHDYITMDDIDDSFYHIKWNNDYIIYIVNITTATNCKLIDQKRIDYGKENYDFIDGKVSNSGGNMESGAIWVITN